jgi:hypothetical protein
MSYTFTWEVPNRVGCFDLGEVYSLEDATHLKVQMLEMLEQATQPLHIMIEIGKLKKFPMRMNSETWAMAEWMRHPQLGWLIVINNDTNPMAHFMVSAVGKAIGVKTRFVKSHEEARETILRIDLSLPAA